MGNLLYILFLLQVPSLAPSRSDQAMEIRVPSQRPTPVSATRYREEISRQGDYYLQRVLDSAGRVMLEATYLDLQLQKPHGDMKLFFPDGSRQLRQYQQGVPEGTWEKYFANGQLEEKAQYDNGRRNGPYLRFYANGTPHTQGQYAQNYATGIWKKYYADGRPMSVSDFVMNDLVSVRYYTRQGELIEEKHSGLLDKKTMVFFDDRLEKEPELKYATYYGMAERIPGGHYAFTLYTMEGVKAARVQFTDGSLRNKTGSFLRYDESGNVRIQTGYRDNQLYGPFMRWHANGNRSDSGRMSKGRPEGVWMTWYPDGSPRDSGTYVRGLRDGLWTIWDKANNTRAYGMFRDGERDGEWKFFDARGKILFVRKYNDRWHYGDAETIGIQEQYQP